MGILRVKGSMRLIYLSINLSIGIKIDQSYNNLSWDKYINRFPDLNSCKFMILQFSSLRLVCLSSLKIYISSLLYQKTVGSSKQSTTVLNS